MHWSSAAGISLSASLSLSLSYSSSLFLYLSTSIKKERESIKWPLEVVELYRHEIPGITLVGGGITVETEWRGLVHSQSVPAFLCNLT